MQTTKKGINWNAFYAGFALCVYAFYWFCFSLHHFLAPEHQHEQKTCHHAPNETHLHSEEYAAHDCSICQIAPSLAEPPALLTPFPALPDLVPAVNHFGESCFLSLSLNKLSQPRAPPAPLA